MTIQEQMAAQQARQASVLGGFDRLAEACARKGDADMATKLSDFRGFLAQHFAETEGRRLAEQFLPAGFKLADPPQ